MDDEEIRKKVAQSKIPVLVLDQKWHRLFALEGKPDDIKDAEVKVNEILKEQGGLNNELKDLKKVKKKLMVNIVDHVDQAGSTHVAKDASMIDETNQRIEEVEDRLLEIPKELKEANDYLMELSVAYAYERMRTNTEEIKEISDWIKDIRVKLKKNIIKKQNREINNREIYSYMHDIFGKDMLSLFDITDDNKIILTSRDSYMAESQPADEGDSKGEWRSGAQEETNPFAKKSQERKDDADTTDDTGDDKAAPASEGSGQQ